MKSSLNEKLAKINDFFSELKSDLALQEQDFLERNSFSKELAQEIFENFKEYCCIIEKMLADLVLENQQGDKNDS